MFIANVVLGVFLTVALTAISEAVELEQREIKVVSDLSR